MGSCDRGSEDQEARAYKGSEGGTLIGKPYNEAKKRVRKWVLADLDREGMQRPQLEKTCLGQTGDGRSWKEIQRHGGKNGTRVGSSHEQKDGSSDGHEMGRPQRRTARKEMERNVCVGKEKR